MQKCTLGGRLPRPRDYLITDQRAPPAAEFHQGEEYSVLPQAFPCSGLLVNYQELSCKIHLKPLLNQTNAWIRPFTFQHPAIGHVVRPILSRAWLREFSDRLQFTDVGRSDRGPRQVRPTHAAPRTSTNPKGVGEDRNSLKRPRPAPGERSTCAKKRPAKDRDRKGCGCNRSM